MRKLRNDVKRLGDDRGTTDAYDTDVPLHVIFNGGDFSIHPLDAYLYICALLYAQAGLAQPRQAAALLSPSPIPTRRHASHPLSGQWNRPGRSRLYGTPPILTRNYHKNESYFTEMPWGICYTDGDLWKRLCRLGHMPVKRWDRAAATGRSYETWAAFPLTAQQRLEHFHLREANQREVNANVVHSDLL